MSKALLMSRKRVATDFPLLRASLMSKIRQVVRSTAERFGKALK